MRETYLHLEFRNEKEKKTCRNYLYQTNTFLTILTLGIQDISDLVDRDLSSEAEEISESVVPIVKPMGGPVARLALLTGVDLFLWRHVFLAAYAEVALDRAATHRASIELAEARGADAGMSAG